MGLGGFTKGVQLDPTENGYRQERRVIAASNDLSGTGVVRGDKDMAQRSTYEPW